MAKTPKSLETKLRAAVRMIWSRSTERNTVKKLAIFKDAEYGKAFICPLCSKKWPEKMGEVDHIVPVGALESWRDIEGFIDRMFFSAQRVICVICHKKKSTQDRKDIARDKSYTERG